MATDDRELPAGPGKFARRTDRNRKDLPAPRLEDPGVKFGDIQEIRDAQRIQPSNARPGGGEGQPRPGGSQQGLPPFLTQGQSQFPGEPITSGLDVGPGPGSDALQNPPEAEDDREAILFFLATEFQNEDAVDELMQYREARAQRFEGQAGGLDAASRISEDLTGGEEIVEPGEEGLDEEVFAGPPEEGEVEEGLEETSPTPTPLPGETPPEATLPGDEEIA